MQSKDASRSTVLVTGGSGLVGKAMQIEVNKSPDMSAKYNFVWLSSRDADLTRSDEAARVFDEHKPSFVVNLAARVGGLFVNMSDSAGFFEANSKINHNVLTEASRLGVEKCISCLSTCVFPDDVEYPLDETKIHLGPPHPSNHGYSMAKRQVDTLNAAFNKNSRSSIFTSVIPCNIYGPNDNFNLEQAHVVPGLIHKAYISAIESIKNNSKNAQLSVGGTGKPRRQFIYAPDLAKLILFVLESYTDREPIILCPDENDETTIDYVAQRVCSFFSRRFNISMEAVYDTSLSDGQLKKTASNNKLRSLLPNYKFTPLEVGLDETMDWFCFSYPKVRL